MCVITKSSKKPRYAKFDRKIYTELLNILSTSPTREQTRAILKDFVYKEVPDFNGVKADEFGTPHTIPTNILYVSYGTMNKASLATLKIGFYLNIVPRFLWKIIVFKRLDQIFKKQLGNILNERYKKEETLSGKVYWQDDTTIIKKKVIQESGKDWVYVHVDYANKKIFPSEIELTKWINT